MNSANSKTSEPHVLMLQLTDKLYLRRSEKNVALSNLSIYYTWKNIKSLYNNDKFKISTPTWNDKFLKTRWVTFCIRYSIYFEYILKKHNEKIDKPSIRIYVNKIENSTTFKIKIGYYLELLTLKQWNYLEALNIE